MWARKIWVNSMISARFSTAALILEQRHLAGDRGVGLHVADLDHVDELVELLGDLIDRVHGAVDGQRHPRDVRILGRADRERVDVEAAAAEQTGDPGQDAGPVLDQQREQVLAAGEPARDPRSSRLSVLGSGFSHAGLLSRPCPGRRLPAGIIG